MIERISTETTDGRYVRLADGSWWEINGISLVDQHVVDAYLAANPAVGVYVQRTPCTMKHPMQTIVMNGKVARFEKNHIVEFLLDAYPGGMNDLSVRDFSKDDRQQFAMLIGYSVSGFGDLSYADPGVVAEADAIVQTLVPPTSSKSTARLEAERVGYHVRTTPLGFAISHADGLPVPSDFRGTPIVFDDEERAWLAAWMFRLGSVSGMEES